MNTFPRFFLFFVTSLWFAGALAAQVQVPAVSAAALSYGKYADIPVNHHTGTGNVTVPLHTVTDGPLSLPVFLQYHTAGLYVNSPSSNVGLGWNLSAGGMISRTVKGQPDDKGGTGYYYNGSNIRYPTNNDSDSWGKDSEPDIFTYSFNGKNGRFFFDANQKVQKVPMSDIRIEPKVGSNGIDRFIITDTDGTRYYFGRSVAVDGYESTAKDYVAVGEATNIREHNNGWHLVFIRSADGNHQIELSYSVMTYRYQTYKPCMWTIFYGRHGNVRDAGCDDNPFGLHDQHYVRSVVLKSIHSTHNSVSFKTANRNDLRNLDEQYPAKRIQGLEVQNGSLCVSYEFDQDFFHDNFKNTKLKLDGVTKLSCDGTVAEPAWKFDYLGGNANNGQHFFPSTDNHDIDHWGFYNYNPSIGANDPNADLTPRTYANIGGADHYFGTANRTPNEAAMKTGMLRKVTYPTGGNLTLEYEANRNQLPVQQYTSFEAGPVRSSSGTPWTYTYSSTTANATNPRWKLCVTPTFNGQSTQSMGKVLVLSSSGDTVAVMEFNASGNAQRCIDGSLPTIGYLPSNNPLIVGRTYTIRVSSVNASATFSIVYDQPIEDQICGGLRIKRTRIHDGVSSSRDIIQNYRYNTTDDPDVSSGIIFRRSKYTYRINTHTALFTAMSEAPLSGFSGYHIGYRRVVVDKNGIGEEEYLFDIERDGARSADYPVEPNDYRVNNGVLLEQSAFAENGTIVSHKVFSRNTDANQVFGYNQASGYIFVQREALTYDYSRNRLSVEKLWNPYQLNTSIYRPKRVIATVDGITTTTNYNYSTNNLLPAEILTTNSNGDEYKTVFTYSSDYVNSSVRIQMVNRNMLHLPYKTEKFYNDVRVDGSLVDYRFYKLDGTSPSTWAGGGRNRTPRVYRNQRYEKTWDENGDLTGAGYQTQLTFSAYTPDGLPRIYNERNWPSTTIAYDNKRVVRKTYLDHVEEYDYFPNSTLPSEVAAVDGTTTSYTYDALGRLKTATDDCKNIVTTYEYGFRWGGHRVNYVETKTDYPYAAPGRSNLIEIISRQYTDGLGRNIVKVTRNVGPNSNEDIITGLEYDRFGRPVRSYEPYARSDNYGNYRRTSTSQDHTLHTYEASPLNRKLSITPPDWHATNFSYGTNNSADQVKIGGTNSFYAAGELRKQTTTDANGNRLVVFTDRVGQKLLSRRTDANDTPTSRLDTYYLYDGKNRLTSVLPPGTSTATPNLTFTYRYDDEDRVKWKNIPDREPVRYWYNARDELVAQQDGNLLAQGKWYTYAYDDYGRPTQEGFYAGPVYSSNDFRVADMVSETIYGTNSWEKDKVKTVRTRILGSDDWLETTNIWSTCGLLNEQRGNNHRSLSLTDPEVTTYEYDGGDNMLSSTYDHHFPGANRTVMSGHLYDYAGRNFMNLFNAGSDWHQLNRMEFDEKNKVAIKYQGATAAGGPNNFLQKIDYSYLANGMLEGINLAGLSGTQVPLLNGSRGTVPNPGAPNANVADDKDLFYLQLYRDQLPITTNSNFASARYNGDYAYVASQVRGREQQVYGIQYDVYDRMTEGRIFKRKQATDPVVSDNNRYGEKIIYDERGNIQNLKRRNLVEYSGSYYQVGRIDDLDYSYTGGTNRLHHIDDATIHYEGYHDRGGRYTYDANGNMTADPSRDITVEYNHLDLPTAVRWTDEGQQRLEMTYDAGGTLLRRQSFNSSGGSVEIRDYIGGIEYVNNALESIAHEEGRVYFGGGGERWDYALTDHLGNTRLLYADLNGDGIPQVPDEIIQEAHYLPFGMKMVGPWMGASTADDTKYAYNGIEHVDDFDLGVDMATYRTLDPSIGRWWSVDPAAESFVDLSPYNSMGNSPMVYSDPDGDFIHILVGAGIGGLGNLAYQAFTGNINSVGDGLAAFGIGAAAGGLAAATGGATLAAMGGAGSAATFGAAIAQGAAVGGIGGMTAGFVQGTGNALYFQNANIGDALNAGAVGGIYGGLSGAVLGGIGGAISYNGPVSPQGAGPSSGPPGYPSGSPQKITVGGKVIEVPGLEVAATQPTGGLNLGQAARTGLYNGPVTSYGSTALRPVGAYLQSIDDIFMNPGLLRGQNYATVRAAVGRTPGWKNTVMTRTRSADKGWRMVEMNARGTEPTGRAIQYHPGSRRHFGGRPYWKVDTGSGALRFLAQ